MPTIQIIVHIFVLTLLEAQPLFVLPSIVSFAIPIAAAHLKSNRALLTHLLTRSLIFCMHLHVASLVVSHLPFGPTALFTLRNVLLRHDVPDSPPVSEQKPHLIFQHFSSKLGKRVFAHFLFFRLDWIYNFLCFSMGSTPFVFTLKYYHPIFLNWLSISLQVMNILKFLFPVPPADSRRVITFANQSDYITFRYIFPTFSFELIALQRHCEISSLVAPSNLLSLT